jgi:hypothetical protein
MAASMNVRPRWPLDLSLYASAFEANVCGTHAKGGHLREPESPRSAWQRPCCWLAAIACRPNRRRHRSNRAWPPPLTCSTFPSRRDRICWSWPAISDTTSDSTTVPCWSGRHWTCRWRTDGQVVPRAGQEPRGSSHAERPFEAGPGRHETRPTFLTGSRFVSVIDHATPASRTTNGGFLDLPRASSSIRRPRSPPVTPSVTRMAP